MAGLGFLQQLMPEWSRIDCLVVRDFYHRYTVDEHTLVTLEALESLAASRSPATAASPPCSSEIDRPDLLRFALLLHDWAKATARASTPRDRPTIAEDALLRLQVPARRAPPSCF